MMRYPCDLQGQPAGSWPFLAPPASRPSEGSVGLLLERRRHARPPPSTGCLVSEVQDYAIFSFGADGRPLTSNAGVPAIFGSTAAEFMAAPIESLFATDDSVAASYQELLKRARGKGSAHHEQWMHRRDGTRFYAHWSLSWLNAMDHRTGCFLAIVRDGTQERDQQTSHAELLSAERREHQLTRHALNATHRFLSILSHELRTPLNAVLGWSQLMHASPGTGVNERAMDAIQRNARALSQVVNDLLDRDRIASGKLKLKRAPVDVRDVCMSAIDAIEPDAHRRELQVSIRIPPALPPLEGDAVRLTQVLWNLLSNAVKFTPRGGAISLTVDPFEGALRFAVSDTGSGITADRLPHLFADHFQAEHGARRQDGLGLGLTLVKEIVARHGGQVFATSDGRNRGARFVVTLPVGGAASRAHLMQQDVDANDAGAIFD
jgi:two-component system CheB/CheR fusion protein